MSARLSQSSLSGISSKVSVPTYRRESCVPRIVHFGVGGFHRAHQAGYADDLLGAGNGDWAIAGAGVLDRDAAMRDALESQDHLYTLVEQSPEDRSARVIGSIVAYHHAPTDPDALLSRLVDPAVRIVSLTVTEGGYHYDFGRRALREDDPAVEDDRRGESPPKTWIGYVVRALARRREAGTEPFTVMSCDNIPNNGTVARSVVLELADEADAPLYRFIEDSVAFPSTMVDRITPQTTDEQRRTLREEFGIDDAWPVFSEAFRQWVVEDEFPAGRPPWEDAGVQLTHDVYPYEIAKIRLLNGAHSALAYAASLLGYERVDQAVQDADIRTLVTRYMEEVRPTVPEVPGWDLERYCETLIDRFGNPAIADRVARLAQDGSTKIANSVAPAAKRAVADGRRVPAIALAVAAWIRYCRDARTIDDPSAESLRDAAERSRGETLPFLDLDWIFPPQLAKATVFRSAVGSALRKIDREGVHAAVSELRSNAGSSPRRG